MIKSTRRNYNQDFKIKAVKLIEAERYSFGEASIRLGVAKSTLIKWKALYVHNNSSISSNSKEAGLTVFEQKQLQKKLERLRRERDILKKALAYFAADPQK